MIYRDWQISCSRFTVWVRTCRVDDMSYVTDTAPIAGKFIGQPFLSLYNWAKKFGDVRVELFEETETGN